MLKKLYSFFKRIIFSFFLLYGYNLLVPSKAIIPINYITVLVISIFSLPGFIVLIIIKILYF